MHLSRLPNFSWHMCNWELPSSDRIPVFVHCRSASNSLETNPFYVLWFPLNWCSLIERTHGTQSNAWKILTVPWSFATTNGMTQCSRYKDFGCQFSTQTERTHLAPLKVMPFSLIILCFLNPQDINHTGEWDMCLAHCPPYSVLLIHIDLMTPLLIQPNHRTACICNVPLWV